MALRLYKEEKQVVWSLRLLVVALRKQNRVSMPPLGTPRRSDCGPTEEAFSVPRECQFIAASAVKRCSQPRELVDLLRENLIAEMRRGQLHFPSSHSSPTVLSVLSECHVYTG